MSSGNRAAWMAAAGYGIGLHWTTQSLPRGGDRPLPFAEAVANFDVDLMVEQCVEAGAGWLLFTVSHAFQHLPFPSETMDKVMPERTCERDLMGELIDALATKAIPVIFYWPSVATDEDREWQLASGWLYDPAGWAALQRELVTEIGERYGSRLRGWWLDNCYDPAWYPYKWHHLHDSMKGFASLYDFGAYAHALRAGNPNRAVTFNYSGTNSWRSNLGAGIVDYGAGESNVIDRVPHGPASGEGGSQWHSWVWMDEHREGGTGWVHTAPGPVGPPRYADETVIDYVRYVMSHGGAFTYGAAPYQDALIAEGTMHQLSALRRACRA